MGQIEVGQQINKQINKQIKKELKAEGNKPVLCGLDQRKQLYLLRCVDAELYEPTSWWDVGVSFDKEELEARAKKAQAYHDRWYAKYQAWLREVSGETPMPKYNNVGAFPKSTGKMDTGPSNARWEVVPVPIIQSRKSSHSKKSS
jgi:hypothetical protein